jgi:hypothetical protein
MSIRSRRTYCCKTIVKVEMLKKKKKNDDYLQWRDRVEEKMINDHVG